MNKSEFLKSLEKELKSKKHKNYQDVLDYYDELIEDKKESGKKEEDIIEGIDSVKKIVAGIKMEKQLEIAEEKPTLSNGIKVLIATLGILSIPMLIPVGAVVFAILITIAALIFSVIVIILSFTVASISAIVALIAGLCLGKIPFLSFIFALGVAFLISGLFIIASKWLINVSKQFIEWFISFVKGKFEKRRGEKNE